MISGHLRTHTISVEPFEGDGARGPVYGAAVQVSCRLENKLQLVRSNIGEEVMSSSTVFCDRTTTIPAGSRVTAAGRITTVIAVADHDTGGRSALDHLEVFLK